MILKELYESVTYETPCAQDRFLADIDVTVRTLLARYGKKYVLLPGTVWGKVISVNADIPVHEEYYPAIRDNVLFLLTGNGDRKTDYVAEAEDAYKAVWRKKKAGKKFRDIDYGTYF